MLITSRRSRLDGELPATHHSLVTWAPHQVCAAVTRVGEGLAELVGVASAPVAGISHTAQPDVERWFAACQRALTQAEDMTALRADGKLVPNYVSMSLPCEITTALSVTVARPRREPKAPITEEELGALLLRGYRMAQDSAETHGLASTTDIICGTVCEVLVDNQPLSDARGSRGEQVQARLLYYSAPIVWVRALQIVADRLQVGLELVTPHNLAFASPLTDPEALLVLLQEHHTSLSVVRQGSVACTALLERGEREIHAATAEALSLRGRQADGLMRTYREGRLREDAEGQLARAFWQELRSWMAALADAAHRAAPIAATLPHRVYFLDLTRHMPEAAKALQTPFWEQQARLERCPEVLEIGAGTMRQVVDVTTQAEGAGYLIVRALAQRVAQLTAPGFNMEWLLHRHIHRR